MGSAGGRVWAGIDAEWLRRRAEGDPITHAYAVWDLLRAPQSTQFVTYEGPRKRRSYLLIWLGNPQAPIVHWIGEAPGDLALIDSIPSNATTVVVPERVVDAIRSRRSVSKGEPLWVMRWPRNARPLVDDPATALLTERDGEELRTFADRFPGVLTEPYRTVDLRSERVWGRFEDGVLVGVARVTVSLPKVWIVSGVFVAPNARRHGHGRALTVAPTLRAAEAGAIPALFVREGNRDAVALYQSLGYVPLARRHWLGLGAESPARGVA